MDETNNNPTESTESTPVESTQSQQPKKERSEADQALLDAADKLFADRGRSTPTEHTDTDNDFDPADDIAADILKKHEKSPQNAPQSIEENEGTLTPADDKNATQATTETKNEEKEKPSHDEQKPDKEVQKMESATERYKKLLAQEKERRRLEQLQKNAIDPESFKQTFKTNPKEALARIGLTENDLFDYAYNSIAGQQDTQTPTQEKDQTEYQPILAEIQQLRNELVSLKQEREKEKYTSLEQQQINKIMSVAKEKDLSFIVNESDAPQRVLKEAALYYKETGETPNIHDVVEYVNEQIREEKQSRLLDAIKNPTEQKILLQLLHDQGIYVKDDKPTDIAQNKQPVVNEAPKPEQPKATNKTPTLSNDFTRNIETKKPSLDEIDQQVIELIKKDQERQRDDQLWVQEPDDDDEGDWI